MACRRSEKTKEVVGSSVAPPWPPMMRTHAADQTLDRPNRCQTQSGRRWLSSIGQPVLDLGAQGAIRQLANQRAQEAGQSHGASMTPDTMTFGQAVAKARKAKGLSQKELAALIMKDEGRRRNLAPIPERHRARPSQPHIRSSYPTVLPSSCTSTKTSLFIPGGQDFPMTCAGR